MSENNSAVTKKEKKPFNWNNFWDKVTTGLFILLLASPVFILGYILLWFIGK